MLIGPTRELTVHDIDFVCNYHGKKAEFYKHVWNNKVPVAQMQILLMTTFQRTMKQMDNLKVFFPSCATIYLYFLRTSFTIINFSLHSKQLYLVHSQNVWRYNHQRDLGRDPCKDPQTFAQTSSPPKRLWHSSPTRHSAIPSP